MATRKFALTVRALHRLYPSRIESPGYLVAFGGTMSRYVALVLACVFPSAACVPEGQATAAFQTKDSGDDLQPLDGGADGASVPGDATAEDVPEDGAAPDAGDADGGDDGDAGPSSSFELETTSQVLIRQGGNAFVVVEIVRRELVGAVSVELAGLPQDVDATPVTIGEGSTSATVSLSALADARHAGPIPIAVKGVSAADSALTAEVTFDLFVAGSPGALDRSFDLDGTAELNPTDHDDFTRDVVIDREGRVVIAGLAQGDHPSVGWLVRLTREGNLDVDFGSSGLVARFGTDSYTAAATHWNDHVVVAAGRADGAGTRTNFLRMLDDNANALTFSTGSDAPMPEGISNVVARNADVLAYGSEALVQAIPAGSTAEPFDSALDFTEFWIGSVAIDASQRVLAGSHGTGYFRVTRLLSDGRLDEEFGNGGVLDYPVPEGHDVATVRSLVVDEEGNGVALVELWKMGGGSYENRVVALAFTARGDIDTTFGMAGVITLVDPGIARTLFQDRHGALYVMIAPTIDDLSIDAKIIRISRDGIVDPTFALDLERYPVIAYDPVGHRVLAADSSMGAVHVSRYWL